MEHSIPPGPDGFPREFYQNFWEVIKTNLTAMFYFLHAGQLHLYRLNFGEIVLLPNTNFEVNEIVHQMHQKNLSGVIFKINFEKAYDKVK